MRNLKENRYCQRLIEEWKQYGKIIIAVDYDDTIRNWKFNSQEICDKIIEVVKLAKEVGAYITVFTACAEDRYKEIETFCNIKGLVIDSINVNPIELPYGNQNKIYANIFIDDRAGIEEAVEILEFASYTIRSFKKENINQNFDI